MTRGPDRRDIWIKISGEEVDEITSALYWHNEGLCKLSDMLSARLSKAYDEWWQDRRGEKIHE